MNFVPELIVPEHPASLLPLKIRKHNPYIEKAKKELADKVRKHTHELWLPSLDDPLIDITTNSCCDMKILENNDDVEHELALNDVNLFVSNKVTKSRKIILTLSDRQKTIINLWFDACTDMYNQTVDFIRQNTPFHKLKHLKYLYSQINEGFKGSRKGILFNQETVLKTTKEKVKKQLEELLKKINNDTGKRTKATILRFKQNMIQYITMKQELKKINIELNQVSNVYQSHKAAYEAEIKIFKNNFDYKCLRTNFLKEKRDEISQKYKYEQEENRYPIVMDKKKLKKIDIMQENRARRKKKVKLENKTTILDSHVLVCAIKHACTAYKSALTNYFEGNTNGFKVRHWKHNRSKKIMEMETHLIKNGMICQNDIGKIGMKYHDSKKGWIDYTLKSTRAIKLHYDSKTGVYSIFEPYYTNTQRVQGRKKFLGIDPGIRTPFTCISSTEVIEIGETLVAKIKELLLKIDKNNEKKGIVDDNAKKEEDLEKDGEKIEKNKKLYKRIRNMVDEAHWKIANYMTDNYDEIYLGKINMQSIVMQEYIGRITKRVGSMLRHYEFRQRLKFKCEEKQVYYKEVNERFTSKTCSHCGGYQEDLGGKEIYDCEKCGTKIGRDVGASRCILFVNTK